MAGMFPSSKTDRARISKLPRTQRTLRIPRTKNQEPRITNCPALILRQTCEIITNISEIIGKGPIPELPFSKLFESEIIGKGPSCAYHHVV